IDAALGGDTVAAEHLPLAELALATRALRPQPSEEFVRALDARAARGFSRERREAPGKRSSPSPSSGRPEGATRRKRIRTAAPALGLGLAVLIAVAVAVSLSGSESGRVAQPTLNRAPTAPRGPAVSAPAPGTAGPSVAAPAGAPGA